MSAEFEKIVLEKLNLLDELKVEVRKLSQKVDNNTNSINNLSFKVDQLEEKVNSNTNSINSLSFKVNQLEEKVDNLNEKVNNSTNSINDLSKKIDVNTDLIATLSKQVEQQGLNLAKFEYDFTMKLNALFDSFVANTESHSSFSKAIAALNSENFHQSIRISNLENLNNNTKILVTN